MYSAKPAGPGRHDGQDGGGLRRAHQVLGALPGRGARAQGAALFHLADTVEVFHRAGGTVPLWTWIGDEAAATTTTTTFSS